MTSIEADEPVQPRNTLGTLQQAIQRSQIVDLSTAAADVTVMNEMCYADGRIICD